jgi:ribosomal 50S subunit-recycling heat shock protein
VFCNRPGWLQNHFVGFGICDADNFVRQSWFTRGVFWMRIDKYLKVSRLIKRRTIAKDVCQGEKISLNGRIAKPSAEVKPGDVITIEIGNRSLQVRVVNTPNSVRAEEAHLLYEVINEEKKQINN